MVWCLKITTKDHQSITIYGDSKKYKELTISKYWDVALNITCSNYVLDSVEEIK